MNTTAPTLYALSENELHDELQRIEIQPGNCVPIQGPATVYVAMRRDEITGQHHPVVLVRSDNPNDLHALALPGTEAAA